MPDVISVGHIYIYKGVRVTIKSQDIEVELIPIELHDFDLLLGMDWLSLYRA